MNPRSQIRIIDWVLLVAILSMELAGLRNAALLALFISASIVTLALAWKRTLFRNMLILSIIAVLIAGIVAQNVQHIATQSQDH